LSSASFEIDSLTGIAATSSIFILSVGLPISRKKLPSLEHKSAPHSSKFLPSGKMQDPPVPKILPLSTNLTPKDEELTADHVIAGKK
jgi:hypothetical protein